MKITGFGSIQSPGTTKKSGQAAGPGRFADVLAAAEVQEAQAAAPASDIAAISNLLALQEISEEEIQRKKLVQQGRTMLDVLEELRRQLLTGTMPPRLLQDLARQIALKKQMVNDPQLTAIIDDIELRAAVELAKLQKALSDRDLSA